MHIRILDCTLRDGATTVDFQIDFPTILKTVESLGLSGIDYVEIGYRGGSGSLKVNNSGPTADVCSEYLDRLRELRACPKLSVMVIPSVTTPDVLDLLAEYRVDLVRIAVYPHNYSQSFAFLRRAQKLAISSSINIMAASYLSPAELAEKASQVEAEGAQIIYFADSFGHFVPDDVGVRVSALAARTKLEIGFHAHNNLGLALPNGLRALADGASYVDSSLCGMGRGAGNIQTELLAVVLNKAKLVAAELNEELLLAAADYISPLVKNPFLDKSHIACGRANLHAYFWEHIASVTNDDMKAQYQLALALGEKRPLNVSRDLVSEVFQKLGLQ